MAEDVKYTISVDTAQGVAATDKLGQAIGTTSQAAGGMEPKFRQMAGALNQAIVAAGGMALGFAGISQAIRKAEEDLKNTIAELEAYNRAAAKEVQFIHSTHFDRIKDLYSKGLISDAEFQAERIRFAQTADDQILASRFAAERKNIEMLEKRLETESGFWRKLYAGIVDGANSYGDRELAARIALSKAREQLAEKEAEYKKSADYQYLLNHATGQSLIDAINKKSADAAIANAKREADAKKKLEQEKYDAHFARVQREMEVDFSELTIEQEIAQFKMETAAAVAEYQTQLEMERLSLTVGTLSAARAMLGEHTVAYKALAIAEATINTYVAATKALAQGGILGKAMMAITIATGLAQVAKIAGIEVGMGSATVPTVAPSIQPPAPITPPGTFTGTGEGYVGTGEGYVGTGARTSMAATEAAPATIYYNQSVVIHGDVLAENFISRVRMAAYDAMRMTGGNIQRGGL